MVVEKHLMSNRHHIHEQIEQFDRLINTTPCALYDYVRWPDGRTQFLYISAQCEKIFELTPDRIIQETHELWAMVYPEDLEQLWQNDIEANAAEKVFKAEVRIVVPSAKLKWIELTSLPSSAKKGSSTIWCGMILDITERKEAELERDRLMIELEDALADVKTLSGLIPICANCKKIRDDKGYWNQLESYLLKYSDATFSHGVCPECLEKHYNIPFPTGA